MTKKQLFSYIEKDNYLPELEERVKYFLNASIDLPYNDIQYKKSIIPDFGENENKRFEWEKEEIRRCKEGYNGMCGKMYFYFNYCYIKNLGGGKISPEFRVADNVWFSTLEECQNSNKYGILCVKRRRAGFSWKAAADVVHDCSFKPFFNVGMNSKSERDSIELFKKVKFIYDNLPQFLRATTSAGNTKMSLDFSFYKKDSKGNKIKRGTQSTITVVPPTDSAYEGMMLGKWISDEAGKTANLPQMWSYTEDCLMQETVRVGTPVIFGTAGDVGKDGAGLKTMWQNAEVYNLKRFFFPGWMGIFVDEKGNDNKEESIRWVVYERHRRRSLSAKEYNDFLQRYPLTIDEAFEQASEGGIGDIVKINLQLSELRENPVPVNKGKFVMKIKNGVESVVFEPSISGEVWMYEDREDGFKELYLAGCDPADHDNVGAEASKLSMYIMKKQNGTSSPRIVLSYTARPSLTAEYYEQCILALKYYNNCRVMIENNRYRMISHFDMTGNKFLLATTPQGINRLIAGKSNSIGIRMTEVVRSYMVGVIEDYIDYYYDMIPEQELLYEFVRFGSQNTDRAFAFGMVLMYMKDNKSIAKRSDEQKKILPSFSYKNVGGKIIRVQNS
jgi:hypothetical protein